MRLCRELAAVHPEAFRRDLAMAVANLANRLSALNHWEAALAASDEAVKLYRELAARRPDAFRPDLAMALSNLAGVLAELDRWDEAQAASDEAIRTLSPYFVADAAVFRERMPIVMWVYRRCVQGAGREPDPALVEPVLALLEP